jgi:DNA-binding transcriptional MerR regulator
MAQPPGPSDAPSDDPYLQIGEVAERTGVTQRTLRFYEEKGLLKPPTRMDGGFRLYSDADVQRVEQIKRLQQLLGFPLSEIKEMVDAEDKMIQLRAEYRAEAALSLKKDQLLRAIDVTEAQCEVIRRRVEALNEMQNHLEERLSTFNTWMKNLEQRLDAERPKAKAKA